MQIKVNYVPCMPFQSLIASSDIKLIKAYVTSENSKYQRYVLIKSDISFCLISHGKSFNFERHYIYCIVTLAS